MGQKSCCVTSQASQIIKSDILSSLLGTLRCHENISSHMKALCWKDHALGGGVGWGGKGREGGREREEEGERERMNENENDNESLD